MVIYRHLDCSLIILVIFMIGVILTVVLVSVQAKWLGKLRFNFNSEFKILQFTDLHFGEDDVLDFNSKTLMSVMIDRIKPDLVVLSGDMFSGHSERCHGEEPIPNCYKRGWNQYTAPMTALRQPYAIILGNHDA
jgi:predicted MPP superfamily phosphohydrolase